MGLCSFHFSSENFSSRVMDESSLVRFAFLLCLVSTSVLCINDSDHNATASSGVYIVTLKERPSVHFSGSETGGFKHNLTASSSQIYRTLYVEKCYLSLSYLFLFKVSIFLYGLISSLRISWNRC